MKNAWTDRIETLEKELAECRAKCEQQEALMEIHDDQDRLLFGLFRKGKGGEPE